MAKTLPNTDLKNSEEKFHLSVNEGLKSCSELNFEANITFLNAREELHKGVESKTGTPSSQKLQLIITLFIYFFSAWKSNVGQGWKKTVFIRKQNQFSER